MLCALREHGLSAACVFASDEFVRGQTFAGFPVLRYADVKARYPRATVLLAFGSRDPKVLSRLCALQSEQTVLIPDFPVVPGEAFSEEFVSRRRAELSDVYARLADERSRLVFRNVIASKRTGELAPLLACETAPDEAFQSILRPAAGEFYVDLGAYRGDTAALYLQNAPEYGGVLAVEPDRRSFEKLSAFCAAHPRCKAVRALAGSGAGERAFSGGAGRGSRAAKRGEPVPVTSVDRLLAGKRADFLKLDVEGDEKEALLGARETISRFAPKLQIAAYHRSGDLFEIPRLVDSLRSGYRLYVRHFPCLPAWDVDFFFV